MNAHLADFKAKNEPLGYKVSPLSKAGAVSKLPNHDDHAGHDQPSKATAEAPKAANPDHSHAEEHSQGVPWYKTRQGRPVVTSTVLLKFPSPKQQHTSPTIALFYMKTFFEPQKAKGVDLNAEVWLGEDYVFYVAIQSGAIELSTLPLAQPNLIVKTDLNTLFMLLQGGLSVKDGVKKRRVELEKGQDEMLEGLLACFSSG
jgi:hypothetical protein